MVGKTVGCNKNVKSSMYILHYVFTYKDIQYSGTEQFDKDKSGEICKGHFYMVEFDTIHPENNRIVLDSMR